jgi:hypothetical protein
METVTITVEQAGCWLDNHRGHYISRDAILLAKEWGFIIDPFAEFAINVYEDWDGDESFPFESMVELCDEAVNWLNSGQYNCTFCNGTGKASNGWIDKDGVSRCKPCTGTGRGPRIAGQNFPPVVPDNYVWAFNDGDFGLYPIDDMTD